MGGVSAYHVEFADMELIKINKEHLRRGFADYDGHVDCTSNRAMSAGCAVHVTLGEDQQQRYQRPGRTREDTMACAITCENGYGPCARDRVIGRKLTTHYWRLLQSDVPKVVGIYMDQSESPRR